MTTALFSFLLLGKQLRLQHWSAVFLLLVGVVGARLLSSPGHLIKLEPNAGQRAVTETHLAGASVIGIGAMLLACTISGLAAVLLEKLYKSQKSFWTLNSHLAFFSIIPAFVPIFAEWARNAGFAPFAYFTPLVWLLIVTNTAGGLIVSMVLKYADNILKGFAVSAALLLTMLFDAFVMKTTTFNLLQVFCVFVVVVSMFLYATA